MSTFGSGASIEHWISYLQHFIANRNISTNLTDLSTWTSEIIRLTRRISITRLRIEITISWKICWLLHLEIAYPSFFHYLNRTNIFATGNSFITEIGRISHPTTLLLQESISRYPIYVSFAFITTSVESAIAILSTNPRRFAWNNDDPEETRHIKALALRLARTINPSSPIFRDNNIPTE